jgi:hypothetical protein
MESIIMSASCALLGLEVLLLWKYQRDELRRCREIYLTCLEEVARTAQITKRTCFTSLDEISNRLEMLPSRTASAELKSCGGVEPAKLDGKEPSQGAISVCADDVSIRTDDVSSCSDDVSVAQPEVMAAPLASQAKSLQDQQSSAAPVKASLISPSEREPAKPARRKVKKKTPRREARKPLLPILPMNGVGYGASAAKSTMAVKL